MGWQTKGSAALDSDMTSYVDFHGTGNISSIERHDPPALTLDENGVIQGCNKSFERLSGFPRNDLVLHHVSTIFPQLTSKEFMRAGQINPVLSYICRCGQLFHAQNRHGDTFSSNLSIVSIEHDGKRSVRVVVNPAYKA